MLCCFQILLIPEKLEKLFQFQPKACRLSKDEQLGEEDEAAAAAEEELGEGNELAHVILKPGE